MAWLSLETSNEIVPIVVATGAEQKRTEADCATAGTTVLPKWQENSEPTKFEPYTVIEVPPLIGPVPGEMVDNAAEGL